jgi:hypothetical protein
MQVNRLLSSAIGACCTGKFLNFIQLSSNKYNTPVPPAGTIFLLIRFAVSLRFVQAGTAKKPA